MAQSLDLAENQASSCFACLKFNNACPVHVTRIREELSKYYKGSLVEHEVDEDLRVGTRTRISNRMSPATILSESLARFFALFSDPYYEEFNNGVTGQGKFRIAFSTRQLPELGPKFGPRFHVIHAGEDDRFEIGVIFRLSRQLKRDRFCCLFEDGKFFFCDSKISIDHPNDDSGYAQDLNLLSKWIEETRIQTVNKGSSGEEEVEDEDDDEEVEEPPFNEVVQSQEMENA